MTAVVDPSEQLLVTARVENPRGSHCWRVGRCAGGRGWVVEAEVWRALWALQQLGAEVIYLPRGLNYSNILILGRAILALCDPSFPGPRSLHLSDSRHWCLWPVTSLLLNFHFPPKASC